MLQRSCSLSCQTEILVLIAVAPIKVMYVLTKSYGEKEIGIAEVVSLVLLFLFVFGFGIIIIMLVHLSISEISHVAPLSCLSFLSSLHLTPTFLLCMYLFHVD